jgi:hypothetical protein
MYPSFSFSPSQAFNFELPPFELGMLMPQFEVYYQQ